MATDLTGLNRFKEKISKIREFKTTDTIAEELAIRGKAIAEEEYSGMSVKVTHEVLGNGQSRVVAEKKGLAFIEFGTGRVGEQSNYPDEKLPKQGVPITGKWKYYYPSKHKTTKDGVEGWYLGKAFVKGIVAGKQMYNTAKQLRSEIQDIVKKGDMPNV